MMFKQNPLVRQWTELNAPFASNSNRGPKDGPRWIIDWQGPLVVSAVHAVDHERDGQWKNTDAGTGGLAMTLSRAVGCSKIAVTRSVPMMGDANWDEYHPLKAQLEKLGHIDASTVYLDLHGMKDGNGADVIIGTGNGSPAAKALAQRIATHLEAAKVKADPEGVKRGFGATKPGTMTSWAQRQGATAVQLEIARSYRAAQSADKLKERLITGLVAALQDEQRRLAAVAVDSLVA
jgi:N-formylglutamate amidohydrolase